MGRPHDSTDVFLSLPCTFCSTIASAKGIMGSSALRTEDMEARKPPLPLTLVANVLSVREPPLCTHWRRFQKRGNEIEVAGRPPPWSSETIGGMAEVVFPLPVVSLVLDLRLTLAAAPDLTV
jgi:hypothetical protein